MTDVPAKLALVTCTSGGLGVDFFRPHAETWFVTSMLQKIRIEETRTKCTDVNLMRPQVFPQCTRHSQHMRFCPSVNRIVRRRLHGGKGRMIQNMTATTLRHPGGEKPRQIVTEVTFT